MKKTIKDSREVSQKIDNIFEGIFSVGTNRSRDYGSRKEKKMEAIWTKGVRKNPNAYIEYIKNVDGAYSSELPSNQAKTQFLNNGFYNANLVILERDNIRFVGEWNKGLFENATFTTTSMYTQSVFNKDGQFRNAVFDCDYTAWKADASSFLGGKITKTSGGLLGHEYLLDGAYKSIYIFLIPIGHYLFIGSSDGKRAFKMIKSIDASSDDIILEDVSDGNKIVLPWSKLNVNGKIKNYVLSIDKSYGPLGVKNKLTSINITAAEPSLGVKSQSKKLSFPNDGFLKDYNIEVTIKSQAGAKIYQDFLNKTKFFSLKKALEYIEESKRLGLLDNYSGIDDVDDQDLKKSLQILNSFKSFSRMIKNIDELNKIKKSMIDDFKINLDEFPNKV